jgi:hypothetical protein
VIHGVRVVAVAPKYGFCGSLKKLKSVVGVLF